MKRNICVLVCFYSFFLSSTLWAQSKTIDSLNSLLAKAKNDSSKVSLLIGIGEYYYLENLDTAIYIFRNATRLSEKIGFKRGQAECFSWLGYLLERKGDFFSALEYQHKSLKLNEELNNRQEIAIVLNNIGSIYNTQKNVEKALDYYRRSLLIDEEIGDTLGIAYILVNVGHMIHIEKPKEALRNYNKALMLLEKINDKQGIAYTLNNLGSFYNEAGNSEKALECHFRSLKIREEMDDKFGMAYSYNNIGKVYFKQNKIEEAFLYASKSMQVAQVGKSQQNILTAAQFLKSIYIRKGNYKKALEMSDIYIRLSDSVDNENSRRTSQQKQFQYEYEKRTVADSVRVVEEKKVALANLKQEESKRYALYGGLVLVLLFSAFLFNRFKVTKRQKEFIEFQKGMVDEKQKEIVDSITYAKRLQDAILPPYELLQLHLPQSFVLYKPKDIVAGDFYWMECIDDSIFIAAADSTGHGVPGAMVSVVCSNALNRAIFEFGLRDTGKILDKCRELVLETFSKSSSEVKDGMDISLLCLRMNKLEITWSGANNPLWYVQDNELKVITADKQPIGQTDKPSPFKTHTIEFIPGTIFYLMTDGFPDQFGGPKGKKFKHKQLQQFLLSISNDEMDVQQQKLNDSFNDWRGNLLQVDDVCIIGVRI